MKSIQKTGQTKSLFYPFPNAILSDKYRHLIYEVSFIITLSP